MDATTQLQLLDMAVLYSAEVCSALSAGLPELRSKPRSPPKMAGTQEAVGMRTSGFISRLRSCQRRQSSARRPAPRRPSSHRDSSLFCYFHAEWHGLAAAQQDVSAQQLLIDAHAARRGRCGHVSHAAASCFAQVKPMPSTLRTSSANVVYRVLVVRSPLLLRVSSVVRSPCEARDQAQRVMIEVASLVQEWLEPLQTAIESLQTLQPILFALMLSTSSKNVMSSTSSKNMMSSTSSKHMLMNSTERREANRTVNLATAPITGF